MTYGFRILAIVLGISLMIVALGACGYSAPEPVDRVVEVSKEVEIGREEKLRGRLLGSQSC